MSQDRSIVRYSNGARWRPLPWVLLALAALALLVRMAETGRGDGNDSEPGEGAKPAEVRFREGDRAENLVGRFVSSGDRVTFVVSDGGRRFGVLENLNLERITASIRDEADQSWIVTGTFTEFRGTNYLLVSRAVRKLRTPARGPVALPAAPPSEGAK